MASFTIDQLRALPDYQQITKWDMRFLTFPIVGPLGFPIADDLNLRCESIELPRKTTNPIEVDLRGHRTVHAGITNYSNTFTVVFTETVDNRIKLFLKAWQEVLWATRSGSSFNKAQYEATLQIIMRNNQDQAIYQYVLYGCFLQDTDLGTLDGSSSDIVRPSATFSFDYYTDIPLSI
jgi:hypothetical protein